MSTVTDDLESMRRAFVRLPLLTQHVFALHRFDGLAYPEISRALSIDVHEVERHMARALFVLARAVERAEPKRSLAFNIIAAVKVGLSAIFHHAVQRKGAVLGNCRRLPRDDLNVP